MLHILRVYASFNSSWISLAPLIESIHSLNVVNKKIVFIIMKTKWKVIVSLVSTLILLSPKIMTVLLLLILINIISIIIKLVLEPSI